jgi:hypothetical protein
MNRSFSGASAMSRLPLELLLLASSLPMTAQALPDDSSIVTGTVVDSTGAIIPGARVQVFKQHQSALITTSDKQGVFQFSEIPGDYILRIEASGFDEKDVNLHVETHSLSLPPVALQVDVRYAGYQGPCCPTPQEPLLENSSEKLLPESPLAPLPLYPPQPHWLSRAVSRTRRLLHLSS